MDRIHRPRTAEVATTRHSTVILPDRAHRPRIGIPPHQTADLLRLLTGIPARLIEDRLLYPVAVPRHTVAARRPTGQDLHMEEGPRRTALVLLTVEDHRPIGPHRLTVEALRLIDLHRLTVVVAPIVVAAEAARLSLTVAEAEVDIGAGIAAVAAGDVLPPADTAAIAN